MGECRGPDAAEISPVGQMMEKEIRGIEATRLVHGDYLLGSLHGRNYR